MSDYGTELTARLVALGVSRNALARALGHNGAGAVSRWASGKVVPREGSREAIETGLEVAWARAQIESLVRDMAKSMRAGTDWPPQTPEDAPGPTISAEPDPLAGVGRG